MSRLGKQPITIPEKTEVSYADKTLTVKGPKGTLARKLSGDVTVKVEGGEVVFAPARNTQLANALWGTYAAHLRNMLAGVTTGFTKVLQIEGVGYRGEVKGQELVMQLGFSHPVKFTIPQGVTVTIEKGIITMTSADKDVLGQFAANVRAAKKPEPYKGKGIRYQGEFIIRKQGKKAV